MTVQTYADADPGEFVFITGGGRMTLGQAVRDYVAAKIRTQNGLMIAYREAGKAPSMFHGADLRRLAEVERFR